MNTKKLYASCAVLIIICLLLTGCGSKDSDTTSPLDKLEAPENAPRDSFYGETLDRTGKAFTVYAVNENDTSFTTTEYTADTSNYVSPYLTLMRVVLEQSRRLLPEGTKLLSVKVENGIATVDLSNDVYTLTDDEKWYAFYAVAANTLLSADEIAAVNVLVNGHAETVCGLPMGAVCNSIDAVLPSYIQLTTDSEESSFTRNVVIYRPDSENKALIPNVAEITFEGSDYFAPVLDAFGLSDTQTSVAIDTFGRRIAVIALDTAVDRAICEGVAQTILSFVPNIDKVEIRAGTDVIDERTLPTATTVTLYTPDGKIEKAVSETTALSPMQVLRTLADALGMDKNDILGVRVHDGRADVNLSADRYRVWQSLTEKEEQNIVYAIVNTLCEFPEINCVRFYMDGYTAEVLSDSVCLEGILLPNPGL